MTPEMVGHRAPAHARQTRRDRHAVRQMLADARIETGNEGAA